MSLDFMEFLAGRITYEGLVHDVTHTQLRSATDQLFDPIQTAINGVTDVNVIFVARDPQSTEPKELGWTLSHAITHVTATLEETSALGAMLARGVQVTGSLYYETSWDNIQTVQQLLGRLNESRRMCNAFLTAWPDEPHLDTTVIRVRVPHLGPLNAIKIHVLGILHGYRHLDQIHEIVRQARKAQ